MDERYNRHLGFFGKEGQKKLAASHVAVVGVGGLGSHVVQQLAFLGLGHLTVIDEEELTRTNLNRYVTAHHDDPIPGTRKVDIAERLVNFINPDIHVTKVYRSLVSEEGFDSVIQADYTFGCVDTEGLRLILNELSAAYSRPYIDLSTEIIPGEPLDYGGQVCVAWAGNGCIVCCGLLDIPEAQADLSVSSERQTRDAIYGVKTDLLKESGPSVISINGAVASLGVTEFMVAFTGIRSPNIVLNYRGRTGRVTGPGDEEKSRFGKNCYYCKGVWGQGDSADIRRYLRQRVGC